MFRVSFTCVLLNSRFTSWNKFVVQWYNLAAHWNNSVDYLENISDLLKGVGAKGAQIVAQAYCAVGVDAFEDSCEVTLDITVASWDAEAVETTSVCGIYFGTCKLAPDFVAGEVCYIALGEGVEQVF